MDDKKPDLMSPEMAKIMVQQILNKHNISKEKLAQISDEDKERFKELAKTYKAHVESLLDDQGFATEEPSSKSSNEKKSENKMTLRQKLRKRRGK
ncbi:hypothetical protein WQ54_03400 [Bacillus sp. SA1-12]|uniref:hypothetical protein n=1 Tax=Bacillus sp. SA1-12 TaxID=1455638 RepID=UPI0006259822|nr:hypothetical protein [Bacillus sp. SA1-12]KKI93665.1 hypothetical protein WQ54_03400 [Bacillus sp. SA1-12]